MGSAGGREALSPWVGRGEVLIHAGVPTKPRLELTKGFQGPNGVKYRCDHATFELYNCTGNLVLLTLTKNEGVEV